ncbi:MAG: acyl-CoA dehydrogenase family protein [Deltaproteobacteria bacterium]|nr:acyl-CoA dehydrogenase family protein [Deltaproteobacteria bacterium]
MNFQLTEPQKQLQRQVREFVESELASGSFEVTSKSLVPDSSRSFSRKMAQRGWIGINWPKEYGGQGKGYVEKMLLLEELYKYHAPIGYHFMAERQIGPALMKFGTQWQRENFLPKIVKAEKGVLFCLLFSEPDAGSDLAAVSTSAKKDGDHYIINGQKVWTSEGHLADYGWLLAKTNLDKSVPKHIACSEFILDMKAPGVTIQPLVNIAGEHSFNEVFFDNVRVHEKLLVGKENAGFKQIMTQVDYERSGIERLMQNYPVYSALKKYIDEMSPGDKTGEYYAWVMDCMAQLEIEFNLGRLMCYNIAWIIDQGEIPTSRAAISKAFCTQYAQRLNDMATKIIGPASTIRAGSESIPTEIDIAASYLWGPSYTLQGGALEILKNIIAQRGLGLPR